MPYWEEKKEWDGETSKFNYFICQSCSRQFQFWIYITRLWFTQLSLLHHTTTGYQFSVSVWLTITGLQHHHNSAEWLSFFTLNISALDLFRENMWIYLFLKGRRRTTTKRVSHNSLFRCSPSMAMTCIIISKVLYVSWARDYCLVFRPAMMKAVGKIGDLSL